MENNQRNSRKRLNSLILLVAFTAVMLIVSTYAWFSAQKNVTLGGLQGIVKVAEGLEISLDAKYWSQEVDFSKFNTDQTKLRKIYGISAAGVPSGNTYQDNNLDPDTDVEHNIIPTEFLPVSTTGTSGNGIGLTDMNMYRGIVKAASGNSHNLSEVLTVLKGTNLNSTKPLTDGATELVSTAHEDYPGYYAIDFFLKNSTSTTESGKDTYSEPLQLNTNSKVELLSSAANVYGLQGAVRVAFAMFESAATEAPDGTSDANATAGDDLDWTDYLKTATASDHMSANQTQILNAYKAQNIRDVSIWEPNASEHADALFTQQNYLKGNYPKMSTADSILYGYVASGTAAPAGIQGLIYEAGSPVEDKHIGAMRTYALTAAADTAGTVTDIYSWGGKRSTDATPVEVAKAAGLEAQITLQTEKKATDNYAIAGGIKQLPSVTSAATAKYVDGNETGANALSMQNGTVCKVRMYVWLEGQDVDTINLASHGGGIKLDVGLLKDGTVGSEGES